MSLGSYLAQVEDHNKALDAYPNNKSRPKYYKLRVNQCCGEGDSSTWSSERHFSGTGTADIHFRYL